ncbi:MAG: MFS transporter, partial [Verrucomicrobia bacterium]|nr:MFS transporter [Verrucomicrobiota bacterium]
ALQSLALTAFWTMVTLGRLFFAAIEKLFRVQLTYQVCPIISMIAFFLIACVGEANQYVAIFAFGLAGFGCSALLPLTISFADKQLKPIADTVPGMVISTYLLGYGIAAFGVGPLVQVSGLTLQEVYLIGAGLALLLGSLSLVINRQQ